jgi:hypothetical protein
MRLICTILEKVFIFYLFSYHVCFPYSLAEAVGFKTYKNISCVGC